MMDAAAAQPRHTSDPNISRSAQSRIPSGSGSASTVMTQFAKTHTIHEHVIIFGRLLLKLKSFLFEGKPARAAATIVRTARKINWILLVIDTELAPSRAGNRTIAPTGVIAARTIAGSAATRPGPAPSVLPPNFPEAATLPNDRPTTSLPPSPGGTRSSPMRRPSIVRMEPSSPIDPILVPLVKNPSSSVKYKIPSDEISMTFFRPKPSGM